MRTLAAVTVTLLAGAVVAGAAYWGFLSTPESTVWMLGLSALLVVAALAAAAISVNVALLLWGAAGHAARTADAAGDVAAGVTGDTGADGSVMPGLAAITRRAVRGVAACVPALAVLVAAWWLTSAAEARIEASSGEISAWFIATAGWADVLWIFTAVAWLGSWLRDVAAPLAGLVWWNAALGGQWWPSRTVLRQAVSPTALAIVTVVVGLLVWTPWTYLVPWRPQGLSPGGTGELAFVAIKLGLTALLMAIGSALVVRTAVGRTGRG